MRYFLYTYASPTNYQTSEKFGVFGAKKDGTDLGTKIKQLRHGDVVLIRDGSKDVFEFLGCCVICGPVIDQDETSHYKDYVWPDEKKNNKVIYPLRVAADFIQVPELSLEAVTWHALDALGFYNQRGAKLAGQQSWGKKFMGNFIESPHEVGAFGKLIGRASA